MENFNDIKVGDKVLCISGPRNTEKICKVTKVNSVTFTISKGLFYKSTGYPAQHTWDKAHCVHLDAETENQLVEGAQRMDIRHKIRTYITTGTLNELTTEELETIYNIFKKHKP